MATTLQTQLKNGTTVLLTRIPHAETACVLVGVGIGANHERENEHGLAHFFEHMCFKGTSTYPDHTSLLVKMDESGLSGNAYTGREYTAYYLLGRTQQLQTMLTLTSDIFLHSLFPESELEKEKGVILEEIAMYEDDPAEKADNVVEKALYAGTIAEHDILGTPESVRSFSRDDFVRFLTNHYTTGNTIISISGNFDPDTVLAELTSLYGQARSGERTGQVAVARGALSQQHESITRPHLGQTHIVIGGYAPSLLSVDRYASVLFATILGGSMSSRLFLRVREALGACYTVNSSVGLSAHYGSFGIYTGINGERTELVLSAIAEECVKLKENNVSAEELTKAREYLLGIRAIQRERVQYMAMRQMHSVAQTGTIEVPHQFEEGLAQVTAEDIARMAQTILTPEAMSVCYVGPHSTPSSVTETFLTSLRSQ